MKTVSNFVQVEKKAITQSVQAFLPKEAVVPFCHLKDRNFTCVVKPGQILKEGEVIAECEGEFADSGFKIHSSIPGIVKEISQCSLPDGCNGLAVTVKLSGEFSFLGKKKEKEAWSSKKSAELVSIFSSYGILNTFGKPEPLANQIIACHLEKSRFLVVRMFDEDPSRVTDSFIAENMTDQVVEGAAIIARAMKADGVVFVHSKNFSADFDTSVFSSTPSIKIDVDSSKYPMGFKRNLLHVIERYCKVSKKKYFSAINEQCIFIDPETAVGAFEAVVFDKPVVERYVHVTGDCLECAGVLKLRIGCTVGSLVEQLGGFTNKPAKIIINGIATGNAISSMDVPITQEVKSVTFIPSKQLSDHHTNDCILCGFCRNVCPEGLYPDLLYRRRHVEFQNVTEMIQTSLLCSDCSLCNSVCPSRLPLSQTIALLRENVNE